MNNTVLYKTNLYQNNIYKELLWLTISGIALVILGVISIKHRIPVILQMPAIILPTLIFFWALVCLWGDKHKPKLLQTTKSNSPQPDTWLSSFIISALISFVTVFFWLTPLVIQRLPLSTKQWFFGEIDSSLGLTLIMMMMAVGVLTLSLHTIIEWTRKKFF